MELCREVGRSFEDVPKGSSTNIRGIQMSARINAKLTAETRSGAC